MAIKLKSGLTYTPAVQAQYGIVLGANDWYGVIDGLEYHKGQKHCAFCLEIYASKTARESNSAPVDRINLFFDGETFDAEVGVDGLSITQAYGKILQTITDWESDE